MSNDEENIIINPKKGNSQTNNISYEVHDATQEEDLAEENKKLRRKLKQLSTKLDEQLEKAVYSRGKKKKNNDQVKSRVQIQNLELQNAYKMIERLQRTVKNYENKQSYQISLKRIMDLQSIIHKKEIQIQELRNEVKLNKKIFRDKDKYIEQLLRNSKKINNPTQDKQIINKLKNKQKILLSEIEIIKKKQLNKHQKMIKAEKKIVQMQQNQDQIQIKKDQSLYLELQKYKQKYNNAIKITQKLNQQIIKLNKQIDKKSNLKQYSNINHSLQKIQISKSLNQIQGISNKNKKLKSNLELLVHIPTPQNIKYKRY